jgi:hypothetical protein
VENKMKFNFRLRFGLLVLIVLAFYLNSREPIAAGFALALAILSQLVIIENKIDDLRNRR